MGKYTASSSVDSFTFGGSGDDFLYFQFQEYANGGDFFDGGAGKDTIQIRSSMVARLDGKGPMIPTDERYDYAGIEFRGFEVLSFYPMAGMDMPGVVTLTSDQFGTDEDGNALISNKLELTGSDYSPTDVQQVIVNLVAGDTDFSAAGWSFTNVSIGALPVKWTSGQDIIRLNGSVGDNRIAGSSQSDIINGRGGVDTIDYSSEKGAVQLALSGSAASTAKIAGGEPDTLLNIENVVGGKGDDRLSGDSRANLLAGSGGDDTLKGGSGGDTLNGGAGSDRMTGGSGNDVYVVDSSGDTPAEARTGGTDTVRSSVTWTLARYFENLTLMGADDIAATGNSSANTITGNAGDNLLKGGGGADVFVFTASDFGQDTIVDFIASGGGHDILQFDHSLFADAAAALAAAEQVGDDVVISTSDPADRVTLRNCELSSLSLGDFMVT